MQQNDTVFKLELDSLKSYMFKVGLTEEALTKDFRRSWEQHESMNPSENPVTQRFGLEDLVALNRRMLAEKCALIITSIQEFLSVYAPMYGLPNDPRFITWLSSINTINYYSYDLNAYVLAKEQPMIKFGRAIQDAMGAVVAPAFVNLILEVKDGRFKFNSTIEEMAPQIPVFFEALYKSINNWTFGTFHGIFGAADEFLKFRPDTYPICRMLTESITEFVLLHEYAHVILGHYINYEGRKSEIEADNLAMNILLTRSHVSGDPGLQTLDRAISGVGPVILFYIFRCIEKLSGTPPSSNHPLSYWRANYITFIGKERMRESSGYSFYANFLNAIYIIFGKVFKAYEMSHLDFKTQFDIGVDPMDFRLINHEGLVQKYVHSKQNGRKG